MRTRIAGMGIGGLVALALAGSAFAQDRGQEPRDGAQGREQQQERNQAAFQGGSYDQQTLQDDWYFDSYTTARGSAWGYHPQSSFKGSYDPGKADNDDWFFDHYEMYGEMGGGRQIPNPRPGEGIGPRQGDDGYGGRSARPNEGQRGDEGNERAGQGKQGKQTQPESFTGKIEHVKQVDVMDTDAVRSVVLLTSAKGDAIVVDLGPTNAMESGRGQGGDGRQGRQGGQGQQGRGMSADMFEEGQNLMVEGRFARVGDRAVLFADTVTVDGNDIRIEQDMRLYEGGGLPTPGVNGEISGEILREKEVQIEGRDMTHTVVLVDSDQGLLPVDLGPTDRIADLDLSIGDRIDVSGVPQAVGDRLVVWADTLEANGKTYDLQNRQQERNRGGRGGGRM